MSQERTYPHTCPECGIAHGIHQYNCPVKRTITATEPLGGYCVRECRGHWHVTHWGDENDIMVPGDPFQTRGEALAAADALNRAEGGQAYDLLRIAQLLEEFGHGFGSGLTSQESEADASLLRSLATELLDERYWCGCIRHARWTRCERHGALEHDAEPPTQSVDKTREIL